MSTLVFIGVFDYGGEGGIRTPDTLLGCNCLAGSPVRPLQHLSAAAPRFSLQESTGSYYRSRAAARGPAAISSALTSKSTRIVRRRDLAAPINAPEEISAPRILLDTVSGHLLQAVTLQCLTL